MENPIPKRWKIAIIAALASGLTAMFNIPESYGIVAQVLGSIL